MVANGGDVQNAPGFTIFPFVHEGQKHDVLRLGVGPGVLLMHELPGMTIQCLSLGRRIADAGFTVYLPLLVGQPGKRSVMMNWIKLCVSREFMLLSSHGNGPITEWLRALCRRIHAECKGPGIGFISMCLTGGFVLSTMLEPAVLAAVTSQPALPMFPLTESRRRAFTIPEGHLEQASSRRDIELLGLRFSEDKFCPRQRFDALQSSFDGRFTRIDIFSGNGNPHGINARAHRDRKSVV